MRHALLASIVTLLVFQVGHPASAGTKSGQKQIHPASQESDPKKSGKPEKIGEKKAAFETILDSRAPQPSRNLASPFSDSAAPAQQGALTYVPMTAPIASHSVATDLNPSDCIEITSGQSLAQTLRNPLAGLLSESTLEGDVISPVGLSQSLQNPQKKQKSKGSKRIGKARMPGQMRSLSDGESDRLKAKPNPLKSKSDPSKSRALALTRDQLAQEGHDLRVLYSLATTPQLDLSVETKRNAVTLSFNEDDAEVHLWPPDITYLYKDLGSSYLKTYPVERDGRESGRTAYPVLVRTDQGTYQVCIKKKNTEPDCSQPGTPNGLYDFVVNKDGDTLVPKVGLSEDGFQMQSGSHAKLGLGMPARFAGSVVFSKGELKSWDNDSGTYKFPPQLNYQAPLFKDHRDKFKKHDP